MHTPDNENTTTRTSAAQIDRKAELRMKKSRLLFGALEIHKENRWNALNELANIAAHLTSSAQEDRQWAKQRVRDLVKLGTEDDKHESY